MVGFSFFFFLLALVLVSGGEISSQLGSGHMTDVTLKGMSLEPRSPVYVLMGASFGYTLKVLRGNVPQAVQLPSSQHRWYVLNSSVAQVDYLTGVTKALSLGATTVVVENTRVAGYIEGSSINVVTPSTFILYLSPWSGDESEPLTSSMPWYVVSGRQYLIRMKIFSGRHEIYVTETDDIKLYGDSLDYFKIVSVSDDLSSRILKAISPGLGELTATLTYWHQDSKKVLKLVQKIRVCEKVQFKLNSEDKILLPWIPDVYQEMELIVIGGCASTLNDYKWFTSDMSILAVSVNGIIQVKRPGIAIVKVVSTFDPQNFDEVIVEVSIPCSMVMLQNFPIETVVGSSMQVAVTMKASNGASFSRCDVFNSLIKWKTGMESFVIVNATSEIMILDELDSNLPWSHAYIYDLSPGRTLLQATLAKEFRSFDKTLSRSINLKATLSIRAYLPLSPRNESGLCPALATVSGIYDFVQGQCPAPSDAVRLQLVSTPRLKWILTYLWYLFIILVLPPISTKLVMMVPVVIVKLLFKEEEKKEEKKEENKEKLLRKLGALLNGSFGSCGVSKRRRNENRRKNTGKEERI